MVASSRPSRSERAPQGHTGPSTPAASPLPPISAGREPFEAVAQRVLPSVVNVTTDVYQASPTGAARRGQGVGTGFIVGADGVDRDQLPRGPGRLPHHRLHLGEGADPLRRSRDRRRLRARPRGPQGRRDRASPRSVSGRATDLRLGQQVVAIGYALALEGGPSVTAGIVSSLDRTIEVQDPQCTVCPNGVRTYSDVVQTDAAINHGNSGGPLVDMSGRVVASTRPAADSAENIGFAIAIDSAKDTIRRAMSIRSRRPRTWASPRGT